MNAPAMLAANVAHGQPVPVGNASASPARASAPAQPPAKMARSSARSVRGSRRTRRTDRPRPPAWPARGDRRHRTSRPAACTARARTAVHLLRDLRAAVDPHHERVQPARAHEREDPRVLVARRALLGLRAEPGRRLGDLELLHPHRLPGRVAGRDLDRRLIERAHDGDHVAGRLRAVLGAVEGEDVAGQQVLAARALGAHHAAELLARALDPVVVEPGLVVDLGLAVDAVARLLERHPAAAC